MWNFEYQIIYTEEVKKKKKLYILNTNILPIPIRCPETSYSLPLLVISVK